MQKISNYILSRLPTISKQAQTRGIFLTALIFCLLFAIAGSLISLHRFWQYEVFLYDFGIYDQAIWKIAHFQAPIIEHIVISGKWIFADHFTPSLWLLAPLYWFTDKSEILFIAQAVCVSLSGFMLFLIGRKITKNDLFSLVILLCYFLFAGLQNAVIIDFHEVTIATLFFILTYFFLLRKQYLLYAVFLLITLGFKESNFLLGIGIGISVFFIDKKLWKLALATCIFSLVYGMTVMHLIIPFFSHDGYHYNQSISANPLAIATSFVDKPVKLHTLFFSFASFGFLPLLSPAFYALLFQDFLVRFYPELQVTRWTLGLHYSALTAVIMGIGSLFSYSFLKKILRKQLLWYIFLGIISCNALFLYRFILHGSFGLAYNPVFYQHTKDFDFLNNMVKLIPKDASVMTQNNLIPHFTHQKVYLLLNDGYFSRIQPDYVLFDIRDGQGANNLWGTSDIQAILRTIRNDPHYTNIYHQGDQYVFKKK